MGRKVSDHENRTETRHRQMVSLQGTGAGGALKWSATNQSAAEEDLPLN